MNKISAVLPLMCCYYKIEMYITISPPIISYAFCPKATVLVTYVVGVSPTTALNASTSGRGPGTELLIGR